MTPFERSKLELEKASIEEKSLIKHYLLSPEPVPDDVSEKLRTTIHCARMFLANKEQKDALLASLDKPQSYTFSKDNLSQDFFMSFVENISSFSRTNIAEALKNGNTSKLSRSDAKILALIVFYLSVENCPEEHARVTEIQGIPSALIDKIMNQSAAEEQIVMPVELFQPELPLISTAEQEVIPSPLSTVKSENATRHKKTFIISISKLAQKAINLIPDQKSYEMVVTPKSIALPTTIRVSLGMPDGVQTKQKLTYFDRVVEDAVGTLFEQGFRDITPEMVYRQVMGTPSDAVIREKAAERIDQSIMKMASTWTKIDCTEQLKKLHRETQKGTIAGMLMQGIRIELRLRNGQVRTGWKINAPPMIFNYSRMISQVVSLPIQILDTGKVKNTQDAILAKYYLIAQIERIRKMPDSGKILYDKLFEVTGDTAAQETKQIKSKRIAQIKSILNGFCEQGYIAGYKETMKGRLKDGVIIKLPPPSVS